MFKLQVAALAAMTALLSFQEPASAQNTPDWMKTAVFYQLYPSSFKDTDGDGIGDLKGIREELDYIQSVGINTVWLNPTFESAWEDGGYDIIDFYKIDPRFGTNTDMVDLINDIHARGMKLCLDLVAGHASDKSPWFKESASGENLHYSDYFIWTNEQETAPGGVDIAGSQVAPRVRSSYVEGNYPRAKYYRRNAGPFQPALNYGFGQVDPNHPWEQPVDAPGPQAVRRELRNIMQFWFEKGVDGFRVDMAGSLVKNDPDRKETIKLWNEIRDWMDKEWPECVLISEWGNPVQAIQAGFDMDFMFHFGIPGYSSMLFRRDTPFGNYNRANTYTDCYFDIEGKGDIKEFVENYSAAFKATKGRGYISIPSSNHDYQRPNIASRNTIDQLKVTMTFFLTMPGVPIIYYGDEIGMKWYMDLPDKEGSGNRSGCRTPMQWTTGYNAGYSTCKPEELYLPIDTDGGKLTVEAQQNDPNSLLNFTRAILALRKDNPALGNVSDWELVSDINQPYPMVYKRTDGQKTFIVALNPSGRTVKATIAKQGSSAQMVIGDKAKGKYKSGKTTDQIEMKAASSFIFEVK